MKLYRKIVVENNWGHISYKFEGERDQLKFATGTKVAVRWTDGSETEEVVSSEMVHDTINDHGVPYSYSTVHCYFSVNHRGVTVKVPIHKCEIALLS